MIDEETGDLNEAPVVIVPPKLPPLDMTHATPELFAALAAAQARVATLGKDGTNRHGGYNYTTADSMIRGAREARASTGLALLTTWSFAELDGDADGDGQWPCAIVTMHFVLCHASGGWLSGKLSMHAIGSRRRPPDKAIAAAATYAEGFIERGLMRLDRAEEADDDVERRDERDTVRRPQQPQKQQSRPATKQTGSALGDCKDASALEAWIKRYGAACQRAGKVGEIEARAEALGCTAEDESGEVTAAAWVARRLPRTEAA